MPESHTEGGYPGISAGAADPNPGKVARGLQKPALTATLLVIHRVK